MRWDGHIFELRFTDKKLGGGRTVRKAALDKCSDIRIIADKSSVEIYLDGGRTVLSSRMYPESDKVRMTIKGLNAELFALRGMEASYLGE